MAEDEGVEPLALRLAPGSNRIAPHGAPSSLFWFSFWCWETQRSRRSYACLVKHCSCLFDSAFASGSNTTSAFGCSALCFCLCGCYAIIAFCWFTEQTVHDSSVLAEGRGIEPQPVTVPFFSKEGQAQPALPSVGSPSRNRTSYSGSKPVASPFGSGTIWRIRVESNHST